MGTLIIQTISRSRIPDWWQHWKNVIYVDVVDEINVFLKEMIEAQLDEEMIDDEIAIESIYAPKAVEQVDKKDANELEEDLEYNDEDEDIDVIA